GIGDADLIIEAATENSVVKKKIFAAMDTYAKPNCILATNTSSISISELAAATQRPTQVIGMHFMNPVPVMKLVEVINSKETDPSVTKTIVSLTEQLGKIPCVVNDFPGFIANRILMPMINEAIIALSEGVSDAGTIDQIMKLGMAHPMGPLQLADYIGLDVCKNILEIMEAGFNNSKYAPAGLLVQKVAEGKLGVKTGEGFYKY
ncbi:MAG TPA: 3-hydroxybutyryl-CoA dehydrogenase, partial [Chitinophagaceae bacterium]|nr:3-hydroxybutyryl-CoA dehydrogenase [Chitinophagaceae bacterium]